MTISSKISNSALDMITDELPRPDARSTVNSGTNGTNTALPRPIGARPNVTDAGRIKFGAGFRLPSSK